MANHRSDEKIVYVGDSRVKDYKKSNVPQDYSAYPGKSEAFIPNFLLKEWMVGSVFLVGYMALIISHDPPLGYPADPLTTGFIPMPDWYFLFMYQLLKYPYMADQYIVFGTLVVPGLLFGGLLLAPFLDTGPERKWYKRPMASSFMLLSIVAIFFLTYVSWAHYQHELEVQGLVPEHIERAEKIKAGEAVRGAESPNDEVAIVDEDSEGYEIYKRASCVSCHGALLDGRPGLIGIGDKFSRDELVAIMHDGRGAMPAEQWDASIKLGISEEEMNTLADWLAAQKEENLSGDGEAAEE